WLNATEIPQQVQEKTQELNREMTLKAWENLTPVQRFALIKLSRPSHENHNFLPALQEFNLA
ncbi:nitrate reductase associated protein, partial [Geitlerinema calcuttense]